ncbi:ATP synthase F0 subunit 8 (mitochondrion) [Esox lucius]|uniref:ATP synthase complex subunit 8 n=1 Tax=Esox lucius TaxID=8010 RepID=Q85D55_ESOLU|nr:ATP synthase F0 subunit 8 [Esox lucius]AKZ29984.1 ATP synthase F0 subunit 8 [Esox lucius]AKZ29997.1 ATP synthase F0 subunit 8 [Esox lucius]AKZ30010.1 ATP synthase F0 subunit 8 [Esox lucius]AKZ30023.1 ATP synthase F0 subunit 8 [Esox lucius]QPF96582.1 ATP synthase subunit 8 [Esox lucius]
MPQLNPAPWLSILVFSWFVFLFVIPPKVLNHSFMNEPAPQSAEKPKFNPWNWPWY